MKSGIEASILRYLQDRTDEDVFLRDLELEFQLDAGQIRGALSRLKRKPYGDRVLVIAHGQCWRWKGKDTSEVSNPETKKATSGPETTRPRDVSGPPEFTYVGMMDDGAVLLKSRESQGAERFFVARPLK